MKHIKLFSTEREYETFEKVPPMVSYIESTERLVYDPKHAVDKFINPVIMAICYNQGWAANENYLTFEEAAGITFVGTAFRANTQITSFAEFKYFTGITDLRPGQGIDGVFADCTNLKKLVLPKSIEIYGGRPFVNTGLNGIDIPSNVKSIENGLVSSRGKGSWAGKYVIIRSETIPTMNNYTWESFAGRLYVPDSLVEDYKANQYVSSIADLVFPISQFPIDYPDE